MKIDYKNLDFIDSKLKRVLSDAEEMLDDAVITSLYRINDSGVHGTLPLRGTDLRCHDDALGRRIETAINDLWEYDPTRPHMNVCKYHDVGQGKHLHFQVHPRTEIRL